MTTSGGSVTSIKLSEDNTTVNGASQQFDWRVIQVGSPNWPSNFIHFKDIPQSPPAVTDKSGTLQGDFNGDGKTDTAVFLDYGNAQTKLWVWTSTGSGVNSPALWWDSGAGNLDWSTIKPFVGDFNGDGKADVGAFVNYGNGETKLWVWLSTGSSFSAPALWWDSGAGNLDWTKVKAVSGDFNNDGKTDVAAFVDYGSSQTKLWVWTSTGSAFNNPGMWWDSGAGNLDWNKVKAVSGDFTGDGKADVGAFVDYGSAQTKFWVWPSTGSAFSSPGMWWDGGVNNVDWNKIKPVAGDFNNDGKTDVAVFLDYGSAQTKLWVWTSTGTGVNNPALWWDSGAGNLDWNKVKPAVGDFTGDGKADVGAYVDYGNAQTKFWDWTSTGSAFNSPSLWWDGGTNNVDWNKVLVS
jgi:hypothetical protein